MHARALCCCQLLARGAGSPSADSVLGGSCCCSAHLGFLQMALKWYVESSTIHNAGVVLVFFRQSLIQVSMKNL